MKQPTLSDLQHEDLLDEAREVQRELTDAREYPGDEIYALDKLDAVEAYLRSRLKYVIYEAHEELNRAIDLVAIARDEVTR